jgi:hypothetical protein
MWLIVVVKDFLSKNDKRLLKFIYNLLSMIIKKNWFYDLSFEKENEIIIAKWIIVSLFDCWKVSRKIYLKENSKVDFYLFTKKEETSSIEFFQKWENSILEIKYLLFSKDLNNIDSKIFTEISANYCKTNVKILSIVWENWKVFVDWVVKVNKNLKGLDCHLFEENIFLWELWQIEAKPKLLIESNDVKASHSCKVERINKEKMFYLKSRGISENEVVKLLLEANIKSLFLWLSMINKIFIKQLFKNFAN